MDSPSRTNVFRRIVTMLLFSLAFAGSLIVFPNSIATMAAFWLAVASVASAHKRPTWLILVACGAILAVKQPDWSPASIAFLLSLMVVAAILFWRRKENDFVNTSRNVPWAMIAALWVIWLAWVWESYDGSHTSSIVTLDSDRPIVCVGDSLTTGIVQGEAYPDYLQELVNVPVVNWGRAGVTAREMTKHLPEILERRPQIVIVELGGHDFLRGYGRASTQESLIEIIKACQDAGAVVVLMEIPRGFIVDPFSGLERELAREYDLELVPDSAIRMLVVRSPAIPIVGKLAEPHLSDDGLHPNVIGAGALAETIHGVLRRMTAAAVTSKRPETPSADSRPDR